MTYVLYVKTTNPVCKEYYRQKSTEHGSEDSGLDLIVPYDVYVEKEFDKLLVNHEIQCEMKNTITNTNVGYYLYPRSSISKTPLRMSNSVGIIDLGYRGDIQAHITSLPISGYVFPYKIEKGQRLFQICAPDLSPFKICIVDELSISQRGSGGFGSTGK